MKKLLRILVVAVVGTAFSGGLPAGLMSAQASEPTLQERGDALMKNVEDMMAHGGMGILRGILARHPVDHHQFGDRPGGRP